MKGGKMKKRKEERCVGLKGTDLVQSGTFRDRTLGPRKNRPKCGPSFRSGEGKKSATCFWRQNLFIFVWPDAGVASLYSLCFIPHNLISPLSPLHVYW